MEKLKYTIEDSTIAELLGVQNFTNKESAILEIVKNAYDAQAKNISISFDKDTITIIDDGIGMNKKTIYDKWMHVGKSDKKYTLQDEIDSDGRILAGSKGIGRFALARLGEIAILSSTQKGKQSIKWTTNWQESFFEDFNDIDNFPQGTKIEINKLRDKWTEKSIKQLVDYLSLTYNDDRMRITINPNFGKDVKYIFTTPQLGKNFVTQINLAYNASETKLLWSLTSDEFSSLAQEYCKNENIHSAQHEILLTQELLGDKEIDISEQDLEQMLKDVGDFSATLYFSLKSCTKQDRDKFLYKHDILEDRYDCGVILYRNAFSISSFEGKKDWLCLNQRVRKSPAAATHRTGAWRVRENQLSGKVDIDKEKNPYLQDIANRQGLQENEYFKLFVKIIISGVAEFERYRQNLLRDIDKKNSLSFSSPTPVIDQILAHRKKSLTSLEIRTLAREIYAVKEESKNYQSEKENTEKKYQYDIRILNILATTGLKAASIAHELKNDRNSIGVNYNYIVEALKKYRLWETLCSQEYTKYSYENVPYLLKMNKKVSDKILIFVNTMLDEIEKQKFFKQNLEIYSILSKIKENWIRDYASLEIDLDIEENLHFETSEDIFTAIFDNLILNTLQQNNHANQIKVIISIKEHNNFLEVSYTDSGIGLPEKYLDKPERILEVHESSRKDGHGLGMWIINNTLHMTGGEVTDIDGHGGFKFSFKIGGKI